MKLEILKELWKSDSIVRPNPASEQELLRFQNTNEVTLPEDLAEYFRLVNGTNEEYESRLFQFYSLNNFKNIGDELKHFNGVPDYSGLVTTLKDYTKYFVLADYMFHLFSYAIRLNKYDETEGNEVLILSGEKYQKISNSFSDFVTLYLDDSIELQFNTEGRE